MESLDSTVSPSVRRRRAATRARSSSTSRGLGRESSAPSSRLLSLSTLLEERVMTGTRETSLMRRQASGPFKGRDVVSPWMITNWGE